MANVKEVHLNNRLSRDLPSGERRRWRGRAQLDVELLWLVLPLPDSEHGQEKWERVQGLFLVPFST